MNCIFGIDVGGTEIKFGKFYGDVLVEKTSVKTDISNEGKNILPDIFKKVDEMLCGDKLVGIGIGIPGPVVDGVVILAQNVNWGRVEVRKIVLKRYPGIIVKVINDANAAAIGEKANGSAIKYKNFVFVTLGTGIGGGIVIDGNLLEGSTGAGGEIGHIKVDDNDERLCACGLYDCIERYSSATGIVITANELRKNRDTKLNEVEISSRSVFDLAKQNDKIANEVVDFTVEKLSIALANIANIINPEAFIIGGGVSKAGEFLLRKLEKRTNELSYPAAKGTKFELATLGNDAGIYGPSYEVRKEISGN
jgi:glucokinase